jgi:hypothetical protein
MAIRIGRQALLAVACGAALACARPAARGPEDVAHARADLESRLDEDQRAASTDAPDAGAVFRRNALALRTIVARFGWPTEPRFGKAAAEVAFLIVQHADHDAAFQEEMLPHVQAAADRGEIPRSHLAYLTDRVLVNRKQKQRYGTQVVEGGAACAFAPAPLEDEGAVDTRRAAMGMPPLAAYLEIVRSLCEQELAAHRDAGAP